MTQIEPQDFHIGDILIKPKHNLIISDNSSTAVEPLAMSMLLLLAQNQGRVLSSSELFEKLWDGRSVSDNALYRIVRQLRKALNDSASAPKFIRTVKKSGYVLITDVSPPQDSIEGSETPFLKRISVSIGAYSFTRKLICSLLFIILLTTVYILKVQLAPLAQIINNQQLTSLPGLEYSPILWKKNNAVIFTHQPNGELFNNIVIQSLEDGEYKYLTDDYLHYDSLSLSPDGRYLAFEQRNDRTCWIKFLDVSSNNGQFRPQELAECSFNSNSELNWAGNGNVLYFEKRSADDGKSYIAKIDIRTRQQEKLFVRMPENSQDYLPVAEPGGNRIAYIRLVGKEMQIRLHNTQSQVDTLITKYKKPSLLRGINWYSDKSALLLTTSDGLQVLSLNGDLSAVENQPKNKMSKVSIDNQGKLAYISENYSTKLSEHSLSDINSLPIAEHQKGIEISPSSESELSGKYSNDGLAVLLVSDREYSEYRLWIKNNNGTALLSEEKISGQQYWSPDNQKVLFRTEQSRIKSIDIKTGQSTFLTDKNIPARRAIWGDNTNEIFFIGLQNEKPQLFRKLIDEQKTIKLTTNGAHYMQHVAASGYLYYNKSDSAGLWRFDLSNMQEQMVFSDFNKMNGVQWQAFESGIYYIRDASGRRGLFYYDFKKQQQLTLIHNKETILFNVSPDQSKVLLSEKKKLNGNIYIAELLSKL